MFTVEGIINVSNAISARQPDLMLAMKMMSVLFQLLGCCEHQYAMLGAYSHKNDVPAISAEAFHIKML